MDETAGILAQSGRAMMIIDADSGRIVQANPAAYFLFGAPLVDAVLERLIPEDLQQAHKQHIKDYMETPVDRPLSIRFEAPATTKDGVQTVVIGLTPIPSTRLVIAETDLARPTPISA
jgi:PAS domain-containing protein